MSMRPECVHAGANVCGEGPVWDTLTQSLYWVDIPKKCIYRRRDSDGQIDSWSVPADIGSLALRADGGLLVALRSGFALLDLDDGAIRTIADPEAKLANTRFNDGKCDPRGRFWCGSLHDVADPAQRRPIAALYRVDPDHTCHRMFGGIRTANGIDWSPDGRTMYFTDTPSLEITAFDYDLETGSITNPRRFATVPPDAGRPDGAAVDADGYLWSAHFAGWRITRYAPDGTVDKVLRLPVQNVTSCAFGGAKLDTLYITTATEDLSADELAAQPLAGGLFRYHPGVQGRPMTRFAG